MRQMVVVLLALISGLSSFAIIAGTAYIVFGLHQSGWWWLLSVVLLQGECMAFYKIMNAVLFDKPAVCGDSQ